MAATAEGAVDFILWPETALPRALTTEMIEQLQKVSEALQVPIYHGAFYQQDEKGQNVLFYTAPGQEGEVLYQKRHLVPFGEYLPYRSFFETLCPFVNHLVAQDTMPGNSSGAFSCDGLKGGAVICFESIFPELSRQAVADGATFLLLPTNDSWFSSKAAQWQHTAQAIFRAVENGRPILRSANAGISAIIDAKGRILAQTSGGQSGWLRGAISISQNKTPYYYIGDLPGILAGYIIVIWAFWVYIKNHKRIVKKSFLPYKHHFQIGQYNKAEGGDSFGDQNQVRPDGKTTCRKDRTNHAAASNIKS